MAFKSKREEQFEGRQLTCGEPGEAVETVPGDGSHYGSKPMKVKGFVRITLFAANGY